MPRICPTVLSVLVFSLFGCGSGPVVTDPGPLSQRIGKNCTVQFRRGDALGSGAALPVSPETGNVNGAEVSVRGKLLSVGAGWVVLGRGDQSELHIPRESILMIQVDQ